MRIEVELLEAQEFACEYYNIPRQEFVEKAAVRYPSIKHQAQLFLYAVKAYDEIQQEMMEVA
jgi:hypothetical protein